MSDPIPNFDIVMPIYEGVDLMDVAGPYEFFSWWAGSWKEKNVTLTLVAETCDPLKARGNFVLTPDKTFDYYRENNLQANMIWTPGGDPKALHVLMQPGTPYLNFLTEQAEKADWVTLRMRRRPAVGGCRPAERLQGDDPLVLYPVPQIVRADQGRGRLPPLCPGP